MTNILSSMQTLNLSKAHAKSTGSATESSISCHTLPQNILDNSMCLWPFEMIMPGPISTGDFSFFCMIVIAITNSGFLSYYSQLLLSVICPFYLSAKSQGG
jgi:hypothetical protein